MNKKSLREMMENGEIKEENLTNAQKRQYNQMKGVVERYKDKSTGDIMRDINTMRANKEVQEFIQSGRMNSVAQSLRPLLGEEQAKKLDAIIGQLRAGR